ncbi:hypothetical protein Poly51_62310 [Rubripirellula tenax]|uniref:Uncharacterized protein n=1 Tax=Rubripirellula tenax TaxID=2528015 RepID=A0A5C6E930_9BACT|nr:hypothetical protein [Rubripirellula tenax]TWU43709.1 hypothetical protein Poly51_62310 [Rubripirellula tenax]
MADRNDGKWTPITLDELCVLIDEAVLFCNISVTRDALVLKHQSEVTQCRETDAPQSTVKLRPEETTPADAHTRNDARTGRLE